MVVGVLVVVVVMSVVVVVVVNGNGASSGDGGRSSDAIGNTTVIQVRNEFCESHGTPGW